MDELQDYQLRLGTHDDAAIVTDLVQAAYAKWVPIIGRNPLLMDVDYTGALKIHRFDLPFKDESLAALVETRAAPDCLFLENLCVSPHYQRQGIGQILLARVEDIARKADRDLIKLDTNKLW